MASPNKAIEATGDALGETIGGMFDIPYQNVVENMEAELTFGGNSYETGNLDTPPDEPWDPFAGW